MITPKQRAFIQEYLKDRNATRAAIRTGYSERSAYSQGSRLLKNAEILAEMERIIVERTMPLEDVLVRLSDQARGDMADFLEIGEETFSLSLSKAKELGLTHLIKKVKQRTTITEGVEDTVLELELYDAQGALELIGKYYSLFVDKSDITLRAPKVLIWDMPEPPQSLNTSG